QARSLRLKVGGRVAGERGRLDVLRLGHHRVEVVVDQQAPDALVRVVPDQLLDVDAAVAQLPAVAVGLGDLGLDGDDAFEARLEVVHGQESTRTSEEDTPVESGSWRTESP